MRRRLHAGVLAYGAAARLPGVPSSGDGPQLQWQLQLPLKNVDAESQAACSAIQVTALQRCAFWGGLGHGVHISAVRVRSVLSVVRAQQLLRCYAMRSCSSRGPLLPKMFGSRSAFVPC